MISINTQHELRGNSDVVNSNFSVTIRQKKNLFFIAVFNHHETIFLCYAETSPAKIIFDLEAAFFKTHCICKCILSFFFRWFLHFVLIEALGEDAVAEQLIHLIDHDGELACYTLHFT